MSQLQNTTDAETFARLGRGRLGVADIVFFVVSAAAPLTVVISAAPLDFRIGGIGGPGAMVLCGVILILFAMGFTAMTRYVRNAGAFYAYVCRGLGKPAGVGVALVTVLAYVFLTMAFYGLLGFFAALTAEDLLGLSAPWWVYSLIAMAVVAFLGRRQAEVGARTLGVLLTLEVTLLLLLSAAVILQGGGPESASLAGFAPGNVLFTSGTAALLVLGFGAYVGFEGTAIYAEEAKDPERTVPLATYIAIGLLAVLYGFTFWMLTYAFGVDGILALAQGDAFQDMVFVAGTEYLGEWSATVMQVLIITSFFACVLAFHNAASRYLFSLGREGLLPRMLKGTSAHGVPRSASTVMTVVTLLAVVATVVLALDPYLQYGLWTYSAGVAGLVFAQATTAIAVVGFFLRDRRGESVWRVVVAPTLGALGLVIGFLLIVLNFEVVTGGTGVMNWLLLAPTPVVFVAGVLAALLIRKRSPERYEELVSHTEEELATP
jgi:amino acid transporter